MTVYIPDVKTRLRTIVEAYPDGLGTDVTEGSDLVDLPGWEVYARGGDWRGLDNIAQLVARPYLVRVYYAKVPDITKERDVRTAYAQAELLIEPLMKWLLLHPALSLPDDSSLPLDSSATRDSGVSLADYNRTAYASFDLQLLVTTAP